jgi:serine acetyltransferase
MIRISTWAVVETEAISAAVAIAEFAVVRPDVTIGNRVVIHPHVVIESGIRVGDNVEIFSGASIGKAPTGPYRARGEDRPGGQPTARRRRRGGDDVPDGALVMGVPAGIRSKWQRAQTGDSTAVPCQASRENQL